MAPPRPLHCTGAQGPSGAAGQTPRKSNEPSTSMWPMVLPESPLLTFSFALWALSFETALRSATSLVCSVRSHRLLHLHARLYDRGGRGLHEHVRKLARQSRRTAPRIPPPHLLLRHVGALFRDGAPLRHLTRLLSTESSPPSPPRTLVRPRGKRLARTRQKIGEAESSNTTGQMNC